MKIRVLFFALLLAAFMPAFAQPCALSQNGSGEYLVSSYTDLKQVGVGFCPLSATYRLSSDVDASSSSTDNSGAGFAPIGPSAGTPFTGVFHGAGHVINMLQFNNTTSPNVGLFGFLSTAYIDSLGIINASITSSYSGANVGLIAGTNGAGGVVRECYTAGYIYGGSIAAVGGLVGYNSGTIQNSYSTSQVNTGVGGYVGGLVGVAAAGFIDKCYATGGVSGTSVAAAGGLAGKNYIDLSGCFWNMVSTGYSNAVGDNAESGSVGLGLDASSINDSTSFTNFDFAGTWAIYQGLTTPLLRAFLTPLVVKGVDTTMVDNGSALSNMPSLIYNPSSYNTYKIAGSLTWAGSGVTAKGPGTYSLIPSGGLYSVQDSGYLISYAPSVLTITSLCALAVNAQGEYLVSTYADLKLVGVGDCPRASSYRLTNDIDAAASTSDNAGAGFEPIGNSSDFPFLGSFHGAGHVIKNLYINNSTDIYVGLFGNLGNGTNTLVDSLGLVNVSIQGSSTVGGLVGSIVSGTISNTYVTGSVVGGASGTVGGLAGSISSQAQIQFSYSAATVTVGISGTVGGFVGFANGPIRYCYSKGKVMGTNGTSVGAFAGSNYSSLDSIYWDTTAAGYSQVSGSNSDGVYSGGPLDSNSIEVSANFVNWSFDSSAAWILYKGHSAPLLRAFMKPLVITAKDTSKVYDGLPLATMPSVTYLPSNYDASQVLGTLTWAGSGLTAISGKASLEPDSLYSTQDGYAISVVASTESILCALPQAANGDYLLGSYADLKLIGSRSCGMQDSYRLANDIDASASSTENCDSAGCHGFIPIAANTDGFYGKLHGAGHTISNLFIMNPTQGAAALVSNMNDATSLIDSIGIINANISGTVGNVAILVGNVNGGTLNSVYVTGTVAGTHCSGIGGISGNVCGTVINAYSAANITGDDCVFVGGLLGSNYCAVVSNSYSTGDVTGNVINHVGAGNITIQVGGLIGGNSDRVSNSYSTSKVTASAANGNSYDAGAFIADNNGIADSCYWNTETSNQAAPFAINQNQNPISGLTSLDMLDSTKFNLWHFSDTSAWLIYQGKTAPLLRSLMKPLTITPSDTSKIYDGIGYTTNPSLKYSLSSVDLSKIQGTAAFTGIFLGAKNVGAYGVVIVPNSLYSGQLGYAISLAQGTLSIVPDTLTLSVTATNRQYNGDLQVSLQVDSLTGVFGNDQVSLVQGSAFALDKNAGVGKQLILNGFGLQGTDASNYKLIVPQIAATIFPDTVNIVGLTVADKVYDASVSAILNGGLLSGIISGDSVTLISGVGIFTDPNVGSNKVVTANNFSLSGKDAANYFVTQPQNLSASITPKALYIVAQSDTAELGTEPTLKYSVVGLLNSDSLFGSLTHATALSIGAYPILLGSLSAGGNYAIDFTSADLVYVAVHLPLAWIPAVQVNTIGQAVQFVLLNGAYATLPAGAHVFIHLVGTGVDSSFEITSQTVGWAPAPVGTYNLHYETRSGGALLSIGSGDTNFNVAALTNVALQNNAWYMRGFGLDSIAFSAFKSTSQIYRWDDRQVAEQYSNYLDRSALGHNLPGRGYWYFAMGEPDTISIAPLTSIAAVTVPLVHVQTGWNMIANPYPWPISLDTAHTYWNWQNNEYKPSQTLGAMSAAWVNVDQNDSIVLAPTPIFKTSNSTLARRLVAGYADEHDWLVQIGLHADGSTDSWNFFGVGIEPNLLKPPAGMGQHVTLAFANHAGLLARSMQNSTQNANWTLTLNSDQDRAGTLDFTGIQALTQHGVQLSLVAADGSVLVVQNESVPISLKKGTQQMTLYATDSKQNIAVAGGLGFIHLQRAGAFELLSFTAPITQIGAKAILEVLGTNGQILLQKDLGALSAGLNSAVFDASQFAAGIRFVRVRTAVFSTNAKWLNP